MGKTLAKGRVIYTRGTFSTPHNFMRWSSRDLIHFDIDVSLVRLSEVRFNISLLLIAQRFNGSDEWLVHYCGVDLTWDPLLVHCYLRNKNQTLFSDHVYNYTWVMNLCRLFLNNCVRVGDHSSWTKNSWREGLHILIVKFNERVKGTNPFIVDYLCAF